eukprot:CAMPEP_0119320184 /NCGR_PEP_ID=MMETSP1333-20130426/51776_1 /TAXON_ID=418940 /ORGANISM="Scyphosphaera apsteinii, Strain RCC1455" /LENGTH=106 /DNA_ID=CAMNT_0007326845 /DNA_START=309 /DNA_END=629 /DNA_ORIENTATION=-
MARHAAEDPTLLIDVVFILAIVTSGKALGGRLSNCRLSREVQRFVERQASVVRLVAQTILVGFAEQTKYLEGAVARCVVVRQLTRVVLDCHRVGMCEEDFVDYRRC